MENNSILDNLTKEDMIPTLRLELSHDVRFEKIFVLLEGPEDWYFARAIVDSKMVVLVRSYAGKVGVRDTVSHFFSLGEPRVIGLLDRDYGIIVGCPHVFYYDYSCIEMMLVCNIKVFSILCSEYYHGELNPEELLTFILKELRLISLVRQANEINNWGLCLYDDLKINNIFRENKMRIADVFEYLKKEFVLDEDRMNELRKIEVKLESLISLEDMLNITNGHDFANLFAILCPCNGSKKRYKSTEILKSLRCAFHGMEAFKETKLYSDLSQYTQSNNFHFFNSTYSKDPSGAVPFIN